jgi:hypothetical protein
MLFDRFNARARPTDLSFAVSLREEGKVAWLETPNGLDAMPASSGLK